MVFLLVSLAFIATSRRSRSVTKTPRLMSTVWLFHRVSRAVGGSAWCDANSSGGDVTKLGDKIGPYIPFSLGERRCQHCGSTPPSPPPVALYP